MHVKCGPGGTHTKMGSSPFNTLKGLHNHPKEFTRIRQALIEHEDNIFIRLGEKRSLVF